MAPRVLVERAKLQLAMELAEEVLGPFDGELDHQDGTHQEYNPYRKNERELSKEDEGEGNEELPSDQLPTNRKSLAILVLLLFFPFLGFGCVHVYAGRTATGATLLASSFVCIVLALKGSLLGTIILGTIWLFDVLRGGFAIVANDRRRSANPYRLAEQRYMTAPTDPLS